MSYVTLGTAIVDAGFNLATDYRNVSGVYIPVSIIARAAVERLQTNANKHAPRAGKPPVPVSGSVTSGTVSLVNAVLKSSYAPSQVAMLAGQLADVVGKISTGSSGGSSLTSIAGKAGSTLLSMFTTSKAPPAPTPSNYVPTVTASRSSNTMLILGAAGLVAVFLLMRRSGRTSNPGIFLSPKKGRKPSKATQKANRKRMLADLDQLEAELLAEDWRKKDRGAIRAYVLKGGKK